MNAADTTGRMDAYLEARVLAGDPLELIHLLYNRALDMVVEARTHLTAGDIAARSRAINRAIAVLSELEGSLNHKVGGEVSQNLARLYQYMRIRLTAANIRQVEAPLVEVENLLNTLAEGWNAIRPGSGAMEIVTATETAEAAPVWPNVFQPAFDGYQEAREWNA